jgi:mono/diheme cytochrome c family protein
MLKSILLVAAFALFVFAVASTQSGSAQATNPAKAAADSLAKAKTLYTMDCAMCHGDNGSGQTDLAKSMELTLADFTDPATLSAKSDADLFAIIRNGKDKMPPEDAGRANDAAVHNLITYIRSFSKGRTGPAPAAQ